MIFFETKTSQFDKNKTRIHGKNSLGKIDIGALE